MRLVIVRHAIAEDKQRFAKTGKPDRSRPATKEGLRKMAASAKGLQRLNEDVALIATSPLTRAKQTAAVLAQVWPKAAVRQWSELSPDTSFAPLLSRLRATRGGPTVVLVGHEPHLSRFTCWLLTGQERSFLVLKKGGACALELAGNLERRQALLRWLLTPRLLRRLGEA
jgi:phosphohistidine phosphatase